MSGNEKDNKVQPSTQVPMQPATEKFEDRPAHRKNKTADK